MFDKLTVRRFVQPLKAIVLNVVTLSGSVTSVSEGKAVEQPCGHFGQRGAVLETAGPDICHCIGQTDTYQITAPFEKIGRHIGNVLREYERTQSCAVFEGVVEHGIPFEYGFAQVDHFEIPILYRGKMILSQFLSSDGERRE